MASARLALAMEFIETPTALKVEDVCAFTRARGIIGIIAGASGVGKTQGLRAARCQGGPVWYCQFKSADGASVNSTLTAIGRALGLYSAPTRAATLGEMIVAGITRSRGLLILDEASHLRTKSLEMVRSIYDATEDETGRCVGLLLAGHLDLVDKVAVLPQLDGRVGRSLVIPSATEGDVDALCDHWELACKRSRELFRSRARDRTGLRRIVKVYELAISLAALDQAEPGYDHVRRAWSAFGRSSEK